MPASRPWRRLLAATGAVLLVSIPSVVSPTVSPASADTGCPTAAGSFASGSGTLASPWVISTKEELQRLHDTSWLWNSGLYFKLTADIDMGGCIWSTGIGQGTVSGFEGQLDGQGHIISNLAVTTTNQQKVGLFATISTGAVRNLGFSGNVSATYSGSGSITGMVGGFVGQLRSSGTIENSFATGSVSASVTSNESCSYSCTSAAEAHVGGFIGQAYSGSITNSYALGNSTATVTTNGSSAGLFSQASAYMGGFAGQINAYSVTFDSLYATGTTSATFSTSGSTIENRGGFIGETPVAITKSYWNTTTSGNSTGIAAGSHVADASPAGRTTTQMQSASTFTGWSIASDYDASKTWGVCGSVNGGLPFLTRFETAASCTSPPTVSSATPDNGGSGGATSVVLAGTNFTGATAVTFGGTNAASYTVDSASQITATSPAGTPGTTVDVAVTTPGGTATLTNGFSYNRLPQTVTWAPTTSISTTQSPLTPSALASALGGATISYAVVAGFTTTTCTVDATTAVLTFTGAGSCTVRASAAQTSTYAAGSTDVVFTVSAPAPSGGGGGGGGSSSQTVVSPSLTTAANPAPQVSTLPPIVPAAPPVVPQQNSGLATISGQPGSTLVTEERGRVTVRVEGTPVSFSLDRTVGGGARSAAPDVFRTGVPTGFAAQGFQPGTPITVYAMSAPVLVATAVADAGGAVSGFITLPASLGNGAHTVVVSGYLPSGETLSTYLGITTKGVPSTITRRVFFGVGSAELSYPMKVRLVQLVKAMRGMAPATVTVGVVREANASTADRALALKRARAVTAFLREKGMPGRVTIGASIPTTLTTWAARRADVTVTLG